MDAIIAATKEQIEFWGKCIAECKDDVDSKDIHEAESNLAMLTGRLVLYEQIAVQQPVETLEQKFGAILARK